MTYGITFDTLSYANKLKAAGFEPKQAEAQAQAQAELLSALVDNHLATKEDLKNLELATKQDIKNLEIVTKRDIKNLEVDIKNLEIRLEAKIENLENKLLIKLGGISVMGIGILATLLMIFHLH